MVQQRQVLISESNQRAPPQTMTPSLLEEWEEASPVSALASIMSKKVIVYLIIWYDKIRLFNNFLNYFIMRKRFFFHFCS